MLALCAYEDIILVGLFLLLLFCGCLEVLLLRRLVLYFLYCISLRILGPDSCSFWGETEALNLTCLAIWNLKPDQTYILTWVYFRAAPESFG